MLGHSLPICPHQTTHTHTERENTRTYTQNTQNTHTHTHTHTQGGGCRMLLHRIVCVLIVTIVSIVILVFPAEKELQELSAAAAKAKAPAPVETLEHILNTSDQRWCWGYVGAVLTEKLEATMSAISAACSSSGHSRRRPWQANSTANFVSLELDSLQRSNSAHLTCPPTPQWVEVPAPLG